jgi:hypothetical protein
MYFSLTGAALLGAGAAEDTTSFEDATLLIADTAEEVDAEVPDEHPPNTPRSNDAINRNAKAAFFINKLLSHA